MDDKTIKAYPAIQSLRGLVWLLLVIVGVLVLAACAGEITAPVVEVGPPPTYRTDREPWPPPPDFRPVPSPPITVNPGRSRR